MDKAEFDSRVARLKEVDEVVRTFDEALRAPAFDLLSAYVTKGPVDTGLGHEPPAENGNTPDPVLIDPNAAHDFLMEHDSDRPADNAKAIAALFYREYGRTPITAADVTQIADQVGVTVPDRVDVTLGHAALNKKPLFQKLKSGVYRPTTVGEKYFANTYGVSKGTKNRPSQS